MDANLESRVTSRLRETLTYHLRGLRHKIAEDFSQQSFDNELSALRGDPVYSKFSFDTPQYVLVRFMGRISISIGRRLGEIYDKIPSYVAAARFDLSQKQVSPKLDGLKLDMGIPLADLSVEDADHVKSVAASHFRSYNGLSLGIEIRYNFNPNDSSRLRKDVVMADLLTNNGYFPIYLIFSSISPRGDAISRLTRGGWNFLIGNPAASFMNELLNVDITAILDVPSVREEIRTEVNSIMRELFDAYAFRQACES